MLRSYKLLPQARLDLENIFQYISVELVNSEAALKLINTFEERFLSISMFPKANPIINNPIIDSNYLRKTIVDNFLIVYIYDEDKELVNIVRVIYAKKDYIKEL